MTGCQGLNRIREGKNTLLLSERQPFTFTVFSPPLFYKCSSPLLPAGRVDSAFLITFSLQHFLTERILVIISSGNDLLLHVVVAAFSERSFQFTTSLTLLFSSQRSASAARTVHKDPNQMYSSPYRLQSSFLSRGNAHTAAESAQLFPDLETCVYIFQFISHIVAYNLHKATVDAGSRKYNVKIVFLIYCLVFFADRDT